MKTMLYVTLFALIATNAFAATQSKKTIKLRIQNQAGYLDETVIYFDMGMNPKYMQAQDGEKIFHQAENIPTIFSLTSDGMECSINGYSTLIQTEVIELGVIPNTNGNFSISAPQIDNFDSTTILRLEDRQTGDFTDLRVYKYNVVLDTTEAVTRGRFFLHVSTPLIFGYTEAGCANNDGAINITLDPSLTWANFTLLDTAQTVVKSVDFVNGQLSFTGLAEGEYFIQLTYNGYGTSEVIYVEGNHVETHISASTMTAFVGQEISFYSNSTNTTYYNWDFGDGATINAVANPLFTYTQPGDYLVTLQTSNDAGCSSVDRINISVSEVSAIKEHSSEINNIIAQRKKVIINLHDIPRSDAEVDVYNLLGTSVFKSPVTGQQMIVSLDDQPEGYYIVSFRSAGKVDTRKVFISR